MIFDESKLLYLLQTSLPDVEKVAAFDLSQYVNPGGTIAVSVSGMDVANQGLPDYWVQVTVMGQTLVECDPDKSIIRQLYADALGSVQGWTPANVTAALEWDSPAAVVGIINIRSGTQYFKEHLVIPEPDLDWKRLYVVGLDTSDIPSGIPDKIFDYDPYNGLP